MEWFAYFESNLLIILRYVLLVEFVCGRYSFGCYHLLPLLFLPCWRRKIYLTTYNQFQPPLGVLGDTTRHVRQVSAKNIACDLTVQLYFRLTIATWRTQKRFERAIIVLTFRYNEVSYRE